MVSAETVGIWIGIIFGFASLAFVGSKFLYLLAEMGRVRNGLIKNSERITDLEKEKEIILYRLDSLQKRVDNFFQEKQRGRK
jgi:hypothetical protein